MALDKRILTCAVDAVLGRSSDPKYTPEQRLDGIQKYLQDLSKDYRRNSILINEIIEQTVDAILPIHLENALGVFTEVANVPDGTTKKFHVSNGRIKAAYIALGVEQPRQKIYKQSLVVPTAPIGAAVYIEYEDLVTGRYDFRELVNQVLMSISDTLYAGVQDALVKAFGSANNANRHAASGFDQSEFDKLKGTVQAYGKPIIIGTGVGLSAISNGPGFEWDKASEQDRLDIRNLGHVAMYKGSDVIELPNTFTDETNTQKLLEDKYIYMMPVGGDKPVKIVLEGNTHIRERQERDWSTTMEYYRKAGVAVLQTQHMALYENTSL